MKTLDEIVAYLTEQMKYFEAETPEMKDMLSCAEISFTPNEAAAIVREIRALKIRADGPSMVEESSK